MQNGILHGGSESSSLDQDMMTISDSRLERANGENFRTLWLIAVWPGMGQVAMTAGYYLMAHLKMTFFAEFLPNGIFDLEAIDVKNGLILPPRLPLSRFFVWKDPKQRRDLIVFIGEAQPQTGATAFCQKLVEFAQSLGVERIFTFAAMATAMHPERESRVYAASTDESWLEELSLKDIDVIEDGRIAGLNGVVLAAAAERGLAGCSLLGEMPHIFARFPFPKASLQVLRTFRKLSGIPLDLSELEEQSATMDERLGQLLEQVESTLGRAPQSEPSFLDQAAPGVELSALDRTRIEELFKEAAKTRSRSYELKAELDRLNVFSDYEDRFLDLFKNPE